ncbi:hypothetical protein BGZ99_008698 [Dissophora globulifera]|uniref:RlpA-like protein double-psi beta-barrel domain-containing protein n=1 Tax=Dissophora globulifera TaxID=979702 RepID=A0A9P6UYY7_9FUNG|nr:hypothetical protein BGZ99_008698 [Dissophora globulifera]
MTVIFKFVILAATALGAFAAPVSPSTPETVSAAAANTFQGRGTWFTDSVGSCGTPFNTNDLIVAMNGEQMGGTAQCGRKVLISANGKSVEATVVDTCPSQFCAFGALDLSQAAFKQLAPLSQGVIQLSWKFV